MPSYANPQSLNRYSYVGNNPIRYSDPTGHVACDNLDEHGKCVDYERVERKKLLKLRSDFKRFKGLPTYREDQMIPTTFVSVGPYSIVENLTPDEYRLFLRKDGTLNHWNLFDFGLISRTAIDQAASLFPDQAQGDNPRNAVQHAYWSALLANRFGSEFAANLTTGHEYSAGSVKQAQFMDLYNNAVGRSIAEAHPLASGPQFLDLVLEAAKNGELVVLENQNITFSNQCSQLCNYP